MYKSIRYHVRNLEVGAHLTVSASELTGNTIRNYASGAKADFPGRDYRVVFNRDAGTYTVIRTA